LLPGDLVVGDELALDVLQWELLAFPLLACVEWFSVLEELSIVFALVVVLR